MIWEPFILALVLGIIVSAGLYFAYLWPSVEPAEPAAAARPVEAAATISPAPGEPPAAPGEPAAVLLDDPASPAP